MPKPAFKSVSDITSALLQPALTSHFLVEINTSALDAEFTNFLNSNGVNYNQENLNLMCSEASLPGSSLATLEITSDFTGVTERHAYRRIYDDRVDLTFYVDATNHMPIRFFESWIKYIVDESISEQSDKGAGSIDPNYFYRVRYPEEYNKASVTITKFERTSTKSVNTTNYESSYGNYTGNPLVYQFVNCYPISISSMPVSYDSSSLLKCSVSMTYVRYVLFKDDNIVGSSGSTPTQQAIFNTSSIPGLDYGNYTTTGGVSLPAASSSGNTVQTAFSGVTLL
jgi:hypothetical protein